MNIALEQVAFLAALYCLVLIATAEELPFEDADNDYDNDQVDNYRNENCGLAPLNRINNLLRNAEFNSTTRIINGARQSYGEWPSYARVDNKCGGVLISDRHVLTAAHCITNEMLYRLGSVRVSLGEHSTWYRDAGEQVQQGVRSICQSRKWREGPASQQDRPYDYAVITLRHPARFTNYVQPACLPANRDERPRLETCHLVGTGLVQVRPVAIRASYVDKLPMKLARCGPEVPPNDVSRSCWMSRTMNSARPGRACYGDSGGPILCQSATSRRWTVVAITSYGEENCDYRISGGVTGFTSVPRMLEQIRRECGI